MFDRRLIYFVFAATCLCVLTQAYYIDELDTLPEDNENFFIKTVKRFWKSKSKTESTTKQPASGALDALIKTTTSKKPNEVSKKPILPGQTRATVGPTKDACGVVSPCKNGGTCRTLSSGRFYCFCTNDYYGKTCENKFLITGDGKKDHTSHKDHCASNPCRNGGECVALRTTFYCRCKSPNYGTVCDKKIGKREFNIEDVTAESIESKRNIEDVTADSIESKRNIEDATADSIQSKRNIEDVSAAWIESKRNIEDATADSIQSKRNIEDVTAGWIESK